MWKSESDFIHKGFLKVVDPDLTGGYQAMAPHSNTLAWKIPWTEEPGRLQSMGWLRVGHGWATSLSLFTLHFHALEKEMATHSSVLAWRIPGMGEPFGLLSMGSHRVGHDWNDLTAAVVDKRHRDISDRTDVISMKQGRVIDQENCLSLHLARCSKIGVSQEMWVVRTLTSRPGSKITSLDHYLGPPPTQNC